MFGLGRLHTPTLPMCCLLSSTGFSLVKLDNAGYIGFTESYYDESATEETILYNLSKIVKDRNLYGSSCQLILRSADYQLLLMDSLDMGFTEMAKALRWQLKGLVEYPLSDLALDIFKVPDHGAGAKRKKVFVAVTMQSALLKKLALFDTCALQITGVSIEELALRALVQKTSYSQDLPCLFISYDDGMCRIQVFFNDSLYFFRSFQISKSIIQSNSPAKSDILLEIQRSIDYCLMELKLPEPKTIVFTPTFYQAADLCTFLQTELNKDVQYLDINALFHSKAMDAKDLSQVFYAIGGALIPLNTEDG